MNSCIHTVNSAAFNGPVHARCTDKHQRLCHHYFLFNYTKQTTFECFECFYITKPLRYCKMTLSTVIM